jgi:hypothetical protein
MTTLTDDEMIARLRASLDQLTARTPADAPPLDARPTYLADVVPFRPRRIWAPVVVAAGVAATVALAAVLATRGGERVPATTDPPGSVSSAPPTSDRSLRARSSSASLKARRRSRWPTRPGSRCSTIRHYRT